MARIGPPSLSDAQKAKLWRRWKSGQSLSDIGRVLGEHAGSIHGVVSSNGGIVSEERRRSPRFVSWKERKSVATDLRTVYTASTAEAAEQALDVFEKKWQARFPSIARSWRSNWTNIIPFFSYPPTIRKVIYTTNAIESMQAQLRKVTRDRGAFPSPESVRKVLYLAIEGISKKWKRPIRD